MLSPCAALTAEPRHTACRSLTTRSHPKATAPCLWSLSVATNCNCHQCQLPRDSSRSRVMLLQSTWRPCKFQAERLRVQTQHHETLHLYHANCYTHQDAQNGGCKLTLQEWKALTGIDIDTSFGYHRQALRCHRNES